MPFVFFIVTLKKKWSEEEKNELDSLVRKCMRSGKPPKKADVEKEKKENI